MRLSCYPNLYTNTVGMAIIGMERVHTLTNLTQHGRLPIGFDERIAGIVRGCCGFGQNSLHRWDLEMVREAATSVAAAVGE